MTFRPVTQENLNEAVDTVALGMADNPLHVAAYGSAAHKRVLRHRKLVRAAFDLPHSEPVAAYIGAQLVGVASSVPPGHCRPTPAQRLRFAPRLATLGPASARLVMSWLRSWEAHDYGKPHVHVGPVAVHPRFQQRGVGSALMSRLCQTLDVTGEIAYLETDKEENRDFYARLGFGVIGEERVIGVPNWFMVRSPNEL